MLRRVILVAYLLIGIGLGAAIHGWAPEDFFATQATGTSEAAVFTSPLGRPQGKPVSASWSGDDTLCCPRSWLSCSGRCSCSAFT